AQFESFIDPFIIILTVPLAVAGAFLSLWLFGQSWNVFSQIGTIMLIGLVTKNGILIVEFANQLKEQGLSKAEAIRRGAVSRLRPILMTSFAIAIGALPIALALGAAATSRIGRGVATIGGTLFSLVLTLYVIPAMYLYWSKEGRNLSFAEEAEADMEKKEQELVTLNRALDHRKRSNEKNNTHSSKHRFTYFHLLHRRIRPGYHCRPRGRFPGGTCTGGGGPDWTGE